LGVGGYDWPAALFARYKAASADVQGHAFDAQTANLRADKLQHLGGMSTPHQDKYNINININNNDNLDFDR
jgi:hypothetical protein